MQNTSDSVHAIEWPSLNGADIRRSKDGQTIWVKIPYALAEPIKGGCACDFCKAHPELTPKWDALCIGAKAPEKGIDYVTTVHFPDFFKPLHSV